MDGHRSYEFYIDMVENKYFGMADKKAIEAVLDCFCDDAVFTIQSAFTTHEGRDTGIRQMFTNLFKNFSVVIHKDFRHVVDIEHERCSCQFNVELTASDGARIFLSNCNFFDFENGKFKQVHVYMSGENVLV